MDTEVICVYVYTSEPAALWLVFMLVRQADDTTDPDLWLLLATNALPNMAQ